jgi:hypothetical protein
VRFRALGLHRRACRVRVYANTCVYSKTLATWAKPGRMPPPTKPFASHLRTPDAYKTMNLFFHVFLFSPRLVTNPECTHVVSSAAAIAAIEGPGCALLQTATPCAVYVYNLPIWSA